MPDWVWRLADLHSEVLAPELGAWPQPLRQLLYNRGLCTAEQVELFLHPESGRPNDPFLLRGMALAVERIQEAVLGGELIGVYGDFDVDGLTAAALLVEVLGSPFLGGQVIPYLPHRVREGYGLNPEAIRRLAGMGVKLLITADCGIGGDREIQLANDLGMQVLVTDHHRVSGSLPPALAVLNPKQADCPYPFKELAGVGVAFKLAEALLAKLWGLEEARRRLEPELDLVALGTVADLAPLIGENRVLVRLGLEQLNRHRRLGLRSLISVAGLDGRSIDSELIAYSLAPRLNAAGRMGDARLSLDLLTSRSESEAVQWAMDLEVMNRERQAATYSAVSSARDELGRLPDLPPAIVLAGDYPAGVVGLVANKLAEEFHRPAFVIERGEFESRGSGRGIVGFDIVRALAESSDLLIRFGGHQQAGGFAFPTSAIDAVRARLEASSLRQLGEVAPERELLLEASLRPGEVGPSVYQQLSTLEPYGVGNPRPLFLASRLQVRDARVVGSNHLKLWVADEGGTSSAIGFGMGTEKYDFARSGARVDCAFTISRNERNGTVGYEMVLKDLRPSAARARAR